MGSQSVVSLRLELAFLSFLLLLLLDDSQELVTFGLGLLSEHDLALHELLSAGHVKVLGLFALQLSLLLLLSAGLALALLEGALGTKGIDLTLTIGGTFLHLTQTLDLKLLLFAQAGGLTLLSLFLGNAIGVVPHNFQIFLPFSAHLLGLALLSHLV